MAEILIRIRDKTRINAEVQAIKPKRGSIILVRPDGWGWGTKECPPDYAVIKIPGLDVALVKQFENSHMVDNVVTKYRKWEVQLDDVTLPASIKTAIETTGSVTVTKNQIKNYVKDIITGTAWK